MNLLGAGGHAKVVYDAALCSSVTVSAVFDDDTKFHGLPFYDLRVTGAISEDIKGAAVISIGSNKVRRIISERVIHARWETIIHPRAIVSSDAQIGEGTVIMAGAIIQPGAKIGRHCIINTGACIDHDCEIGDFSHVAPNAALAGEVRLGEGVFIGIGASVVPGIEIGAWSIIGAGAAVISDIPGGKTAVGVPAKVR